MWPEVQWATPDRVRHPISAREFPRPGIPYFNSCSQRYFRSTPNPTLEGIGVYICICRMVTEATVRAAIAAGAATCEDVTAATGASTGCGTCAETIETMLEDS